MSVFDIWGVVGGKSSPTFHTIQITRTGRHSVFGSCKGRPSFLSGRASRRLGDSPPLGSRLNVLCWCQELAPGGRCSIQAGRALRLVGHLEAQAIEVSRTRFSLFSYGSVWIWLCGRRRGFVHGWHQEQVVGSGRGCVLGHVLFATWHWHLLLDLPLSQVLLFTTPATGRDAIWEICESGSCSCLVLCAAQPTFGDVHRVDPLPSLSPQHSWLEIHSRVLGASPLDKCHLDGINIWLAYSKAPQGWNCAISLCAQEAEQGDLDGECTREGFVGQIVPFVSSTVQWRHLQDGFDGILLTSRLRPFGIHILHASPHVWHTQEHSIQLHGAFLCLAETAAGGRPWARVQGFCRGVGYCQCPTWGLFSVFSSHNSFVLCVFVRCHTIFCDSELVFLHQKCTDYHISEHARELPSAFAFYCPHEVGGMEQQVE